MGNMKFSDLKEFKAKDWDGKPFLALYTDNEEAYLKESEIMTLRGDRRTSSALIKGFFDGQWKTDFTSWKHVYRIDDNRIAASRMTYLELAKWLAQGNGLFRTYDKAVWVYGLTLDEDRENEEVPESYKVRTWDSRVWVEPTTDLLK